MMARYKPWSEQQLTVDKKVSDEKTLRPVRGDFQLGLEVSQKNKVANIRTLGSRHKNSCWGISPGSRDQVHDQYSQATYIVSVE